MNVRFSNNHTGGRGPFDMPKGHRSSCLVKLYGGCNRSWLSQRVSHEWAVKFSAWRCSRTWQAFKLTSSVYRRALALSRSVICKFIGLTVGYRQLPAPQVTMRIFRFIAMVLFVSYCTCATVIRSTIAKKLSSEEPTSSYRKTEPECQPYLSAYNGGKDSGTIAPLQL